MPQIQPVLQRYVVELRQSLRFGLPENERDAIEITVSGPGSTVPGLSELIAWELKLQMAPDPQYASFDYQAPAGQGSELLDAIGDQRLLRCLNLQPEDTASRRHIGHLRRWMWAGAAAALAMVALDAVRLQSRLGDTRREAETLKAAAAEQESLEKTHKKLIAAMGAMGELEQAMFAETGTRADLKAILHELSRLAPDSVRLNSMRFNSEGASMVAKLYGRAAQVDEAGHTELEPFIEALKGSPLFANAVLRNVEVGRVGAEQGQRFEATFQVVLAPDPAEYPDLAAGSEGGEP
jgi:hypothetical protein